MVISPDFLIVSSISEFNKVVLPEPILPATTNKSFDFKSRLMFVT